MSKITDIHDELLNLLGVELPTYKRLPNPYEVSDNPGLFLRKGYGVAIGEAVNTDRRISSRLHQLRSFSMVLIKEITASESNADARAALVKGLMEDHVSVIKAIEADPTIAGTAANAAYTSDTGPVPLEEVNGNQRYFMIDTTFTVEYFEPLEA